ncbi:MULTISPECIES: hypothetical protein [unclassified Streptomyces]|uniref:hypothetical protein n=1 Tax=unclassified Streptomyces TaxID=2593676 RepID=UPI0006FE28A6|nr:MULTISPECIES: hypothetical protein [unclassified Streptomyces]KQX53621.1 hypothetical protein ASD33_10740 [Streptomyces sp. Root1304]KRA90539.1 hypothetical protein ASE09_10745 [Streptomyces sp. Root66D1]
MSAHTYTRVRPTTSGVDTRLPWWALALPAAAFVALLLLMAGPGEAHEPFGAAGIGGVVERIQQTLSL